jgi:hypothetical protein
MTLEKQYHPNKPQLKWNVDIGEKRREPLYA